jgi:hypothetical protein
MPRSTSTPYQVRESTDSRPSHIYHPVEKVSLIDRLVDWVHSVKSTRKGD